MWFAGISLVSMELKPARCFLTPTTHSSGKHAQVVNYELVSVYLSNKRAVFNKMRRVIWDNISVAFD